MDDWNTIRKLQCLAPAQTGIANVLRIIPRNSGTGLALGFSEFEPGSISMDVEQPEVFIVLEGSLAISANDTSTTLKADEALWMPAGSSLEISVSEPTRVVYIIAEGA